MILLEMAKSVSIQPVTSPLPCLILTIYPADARSLRLVERTLGDLNSTTSSDAQDR